MAPSCFSAWSRPIKRLDWLNQLPVTQIMSRRLVCVAPEESLQLAVERLFEGAVSCLLVTRNGGLLGLLTERDLVVRLHQHGRREAPLRPDAVQVAEVMSRNPATLADTDGLGTALSLCLSRTQRQLPVLNGRGELVGVVTQTDLVRAYSHLVEQQLSLVSDNERLRQLSLSDPLMGIGNRRAMERDLGHLAADAERRGKVYGLALLDIDFFKRYNDAYGHQLGDEALRQVAKVIGQTLRKGDRLYRYGGEELMLLLPDTDAEGSQQAAERARSAVRELGLEHRDSPMACLTISGGVAVSQQALWQEAVQRADRALYQAKQAGRDRVVAA